MSERINQCEGVQFSEARACDNCGRFGAFAFESKNLCGDCYELHGSCCPEFGGDDLWQNRDETRSEGKPDGAK